MKPPIAHRLFNREFRLRILSAGMLLLLLAACIAANSLWLLKALVITLALIMLGEICVFANVRQGRKRVIIPVAVALVLPMTLSALYLLSKPPAGVALLLFTIVIVTLSDTFAYMGGKIFGRHKLWPAVSPNKTWEGAIAGLLVPAVLAGLSAGHWPPTAGVLAGPGWQLALLGAALAIAAQTGDLLVSKTKRVYGVKNSGSWIPGHGGLLDRLAGFVVAVVVGMIFS